MLTLLVQFTAIFYLLVVLLLFCYGLNLLYLTIVSWRRQAPPPPSPPSTWPPVTVQLPIFNERYVAERIIKAVAQLDYPTAALHIQVLDDSTDDTRFIVQRTINKLHQQGHNITYHHRTDRSGYKAGALQAGLQEAHTPFIAILDADFIPQPSFLKQLVPYLQEENVAFVQARWEHINRDYGWLTQLQSLAIDAHFVVEQYARHNAGYWFNFNGTAGVWRRQALLDAGGWTADTLTEDLDISYRACLRGWNGRFARHVGVPAELPVSMNAYRRQQHRWARGSLECIRKLGPQIWRAPAPLRHKIQATLHMTGYSVHILMLILMLLYPMVIFAAEHYSHWLNLAGFAAIFNITAIAPTLVFASAQHQLGRRWWHQLPGILFLSVAGAGMMLNTVRAACQIITQPQGVFERTAKFGVRDKKEGWTHKTYQLRLDPIVWLEFSLALYCWATAVQAARWDHWAIAFYAALFGTGLIYIAATTVAHTLAIWRSQQRQTPLHPTLDTGD